MGRSELGFLRTIRVIAAALVLGACDFAPLMQLGEKHDASEADAGATVSEDAGDFDGSLDATSNDVDGGDICTTTEACGSDCQPCPVPVPVHGTYGCVGSSEPAESSCQLSCESGYIARNGDCLDLRWPLWPVPDSFTAVCVDGGAMINVCPMQGELLYGQDGSIRVNIPSYMRSMSLRTVTDLITSLIWEADISSSFFSWTDAVAYCDQLRLDDLEDWRLPFRVELYSLLDLGRSHMGMSDPAIDEMYFPNTPSDEFWTSSVALPDTAQHWAVHFGDGEVNAESLGATLRVRCVHSAL